LKQAGLCVSLFCLLLLPSCSEKEEIVASVNDIELTKSDAKILMDNLGYNSNSKTDWSLFLETWSTQEALRQELDQTNPEASKLISLKADAYKGELAKYHLEEKMILSKLDSVVSEKDIENYFDTNKSSFSLQDYLVTALYIKIPKGVKIEDKLKTAFLLKNDKDLTQVNSYAKLYAENFYFDDEQWIYFNELTKDIPLKQYNIDNIVLNRTKTYFSDDEYTYFLNIIDYRLKDEVPPLEFLKPQIKEIILSKRVNNLREKQEKKLLQSIKTKHDIKIHYH
jgi:CRISPR/Cas system-associated exonuclease Cas4 (RecB family)